MSAIKLLCVCILLMPIASMIYAQTDWTWAIKAGGSSYDEAATVAVDNQGNSYITGNYQGTALFGTLSVTSKGAQDVFVAKIDPQGTFIWVATAGGSGYDVGTSVAVDYIGNVYVTGIYNSSKIYFGAGTTKFLSRIGVNDLFVAKLNQNGNWDWINRAGGSTGIDEGQAIIVDNDLNVYITGIFNNNISFSPLPTIYGYGYSDAFVAKLTSSGVWSWVVKAGGSNNDTAKSLTYDPIHNLLYICGSFASPSMTFGSISISNSSTTSTLDAYVAQLNTEGTWLWAVKSDGTGSDSAYRVFAINGYVYVTGFKDENTSLGGVILPNYGGFDVYVAKLNSDGSNIWVKTAGGADWDYGWGISVIGEYVFLTGEFKGTASFGSTYLNSNQLTTSDIFMAILNDSDGSWISASREGNIYNDAGKFVVANDCGIYWYGNFTGTASIGGNTIISTGSQDVYLARQVITQSLSLISPQGGINNTYPANSFETIEWTSTGISQLKLEYLTCDEDGTLLQDTAQLISIVNAGISSYQWQIPQIPTNERVKVRISSYSNPNLYSVSDSVFTIYQPIILQSMNGGNNSAYEIGSTYAIRWSSKGVSQVLLDYSLDAGQNWESITPSPIAANLGEYLWLIPSTTSDNAKIMISDAGNSQYTAISSGVFAIIPPCPPLVLQTLNGGAIYPAASLQNIVWSAMDDINNVSIEYRLDEGSYWQPIAESIDASAEQYLWTLPNVSTNSARIRVSDAENPNTCITSADDFSIIVPPAAPVIFEVRPGYDNPHDMVISWNAVSTDLIQQPISISCYQIYCCAEPSTDINDYSLLDVVYGATQYIHHEALQFFDHLFYRIVAVKE